MAEDPVPIAYTALSPGAAVHAVDGQPFGVVAAVLVVEEVDVFDGIVVTTDNGTRFVDAPFVDRIFTTHVVTSLTPEQAATLPEPDRADYRRLRPGDRVGRSLASRLGDLFGRGRR